MEPIDISFNGSSFYIEGFPEGVKAIKLDGPKAKRLGDLVMHKGDLNFALECLEGMNRLPEELHALREGLWCSAGPPHLNFNK